MADFEGLKRQMEEDGKAYLPQTPLTDPMVAYPQEYFERFEEDRKRYQHHGDLSFIEMQRVLDDLTYKPNVRMMLMAGPYSGADPILLLEAGVEDTYNPGRQVRIGHRTVVHPIAARSAEAFIAFVRTCIRKMETHEADEWLKWANTGRPIFDPHAND